MRWKLALIATLAALGSPVAVTTPPPTWGGLEPGPHDVGFRLIETTDRSRAIQSDRVTGRAYPRPVRVYAWYPAEIGPDARPLTFGRYADLATLDIWPPEMLGKARMRTGYDGRPLARSLGAERFEELRAQPVAAVEDAPAADGTFPLVVVGQGLYYESPVAHAILCEFLASHGLVVVTAPLVGTHSPLVNLDVIDLETQVRDMEFVIARARELPFVSPDALGAFGYDMGGMAALILAMRNPDVDALAVVDAAILFGHPAGIPVDSPHHDPSLLRVPWFHGTQRQFGTRPEDHDGLSMFDDAVYSDRYLLLSDGMAHDDYSSYALNEGREGVIGYWAPKPGGEAERYRTVCTYLVRFLRAHLAGDDSSRRFLARDPEEVAPGLGFTLEHRAASPPTPVYSDFLNALLSGDVEGAVSMAESIRKSDPDGPLLQERVLIRLGYHLIGSWEMYDEAIAVFRVNADIHPESVNAWDSLGEAHIFKGNDEEAIRLYRKVLELDPENDRAKRILSRLGERGES
jgi:pimeloyl-ACP methyl ester carboxylesterase